MCPVALPSCWFLFPSCRLHCGCVLFCPVALASCWCLLPSCRLHCGCVPLSPVALASCWHLFLAFGFTAVVSRCVPLLPVFALNVRRCARSFSSNFVTGCRGGRAKRSLRGASLILSSFRFNKPGPRGASLIFFNFSSLCLGIDSDILQVFHLFTLFRKQWRLCRQYPASFSPQGTASIHTNLFFCIFYANLLFYNPILSYDLIQIIFLFFFWRDARNPYFVSFLTRI